MNVITQNEYAKASAFVWAKPWDTIQSLFENDRYLDVALFETFEDRLIFYLLAEASSDGETPGRSEDVINALLFDEYHSANETEKDLIRKQVKTALHNLYKARFIRKDRSGNVYLCSHMHFYRTYSHSNDYLKLEVTSTYEDGDLGYSEYDCLYADENLDTTKFDDSMTFVQSAKTGLYARYMLLANRLGEFATTSNFPNKTILDELVTAGWLHVRDDKVRLVGDFSILGNEEENTYRLVYTI